MPDRSLASPSVMGVSDFVQGSDLILEFSNTERSPLTASPFTEIIDQVQESIPYETQEELTDDLYVGEQQVVREGENGVLTKEYRVSSWNSTEYERTLITSRQTEPVNRVVRVGTKIKIDQLNTPNGAILYSQSFRMWATSYDGNCVGCSGRTATGTSVKFGVCAVDPRVIPLGSRLYIPGYGECHAEDTGGAIKGNKIDLGFENVKSGWWSARYTDVYLLID